MIDIKGFRGRSLSKTVKTGIVALLTVLVVAGLYYYMQPRDVKAAIQASKVLIISNDDSYYASGISGGTSVNEMVYALQKSGFAVDTWKESQNGNVPPSAAYANGYDVVIFTQGVGYRNTSNGKNGLNTNDLTFLKQYLNITASGNKARLILEGEDVMSDIQRVGTSTDQRNVLKINTSSSADNYGKMTNLRISDAAHGVYNYVYDITGTTDVTTNYQTSYQDYIAPNLTVSAKTVGQAKFSNNANYYSTINTWSDSYGHRQVFMPFAYYVNSSNGISDTYRTWREQLLVNMVAWVGERTINVSATDIANNTVSPGDTEAMLSVQLSPSLTSTSVTPPAVKGMKVTFTGDFTMGETGTVTAYVYNDVGSTIGTLDAGDQVLGTGSFSSGVATVDFNLEIDSIKNLIVAYKYSAGAPAGKMAGARLNDSMAVIVHDWDRLSRVTGFFPMESTQTLISAGGTADIKTPNSGTIVKGNVVVTGTTNTSYTLAYTNEYNDTDGPWNQFASGGSAVNKSTLGTFDTSGVSDGPYTVKLQVTTGAIDYINLYVDNTAPVISDVSHTNVRGNQVTVSWTTNESTTSEVVYRVSPSGVWKSVTDAALINNHTIVVKNLSPNTFYDYKVKSIDTAGNETESVGTQSFQTLDQGPLAEITSPKIVGEVVPRVGNVLQIKGSAYTANAGHTVNWAVYYGYGQTADKVTTWNLVYATSLPVENGILTNWTTPAPDGAYVLKLVINDPALTGDIGTMEDYVHVIVDNSQPEIYNVTVEDITNVSAHITWLSNKNTVDQVVYGWDPGVYPFVMTDSDKDKALCLYDLQPNKKYYFKVRATDGSGHVAETPEQSFTTINNTTDVTPPVVTSVYLTAAGRTDSTVELQWSEATDDTGVGIYKIYYSIDGENFIQRGAAHATDRTFTDTGLKELTNYWYFIRAVDIAGNYSSPSNILKVITTSEGHNNPHGAYSKMTVMCSKCHTTHRGKKEFLFNYTQEANMCYTCHDAAGTGSKYTIEAEYDPAHKSRHPLPMNHTSKECASCHNPHLNPATYPKLLSSHNTVTGEVYHSDNNFCYACHGDLGPDRILDNTAGTHAVFETSIHNSANFPDPASGSKVKCVSCHDNHASDDVRLTKAPEEENCYKCHGDTSDLYGIPNIKRNLNRKSFHNVNGNVSGGSIECVNCHNPHFVKGDLLNTSDPYNTITTYGTGAGEDRSQFCIKCHDGDAPPVKMVTRTVNVPYTVYFPSVVPNLTTNSSTGTNAGFNKSGYTSSIHYTNNIHCSSCHDPHGSDGNRLLARDEDSDSSAETGECVNCHSDSGVWKSVYTTAPAIFLEMTNASSHPTLTQDSTDLHSDTEDYSATITLNKRHAECWDCHDPHNAKQTGTLTGADNQLSGPLNNVSGVTRSGGSLVWKNPATQDWEVCYKCHSSYVAGLAASGRRDISAEFYRTGAGKSYHFVELTSNTNLTAGNFTGRWTAGAKDHNGNAWTGTSKMYCQDCHGTPPGEGAKGVHGSVYDGILKGTNYTFTETTRSATDDRLICFQCHLRTYYESSSSHDIGKSSEHNKPCWWCHGSRVHGTDRNHLIAIKNTAVPTYDPNYEAYGVLDSRTLSDPTENSKNSCRTNNGSCSDHN